MLMGEPLTPAQKRFALIDNGIGAFIVNVVIALGFGWLFFRGLSRVPLWGQPSIAGDTLFTVFLLPLITCLIVTRLARAQVRSGRLAGLRGGAAMRWLPRNTLLRGVLIGAVSLAVLGPMTILALKLGGIASLSLRHFMVFKAVFAGLEGALVTPFIALWAISSE